MIDYKIIQNIQNKANGFDLHNSTQDLITIATDIKKKFQTFDEDPLILGNKVLVDVPFQFSSTLQKTVAPLIQISTEHQGQSHQTIAIIFGRYYDQADSGSGPTTLMSIKPMINRHFEIALITSGEHGQAFQVAVPFSQVVTKTIDFLNAEYEKVMGIKLFS